MRMINHAKMQRRTNILGQNFRLMNLEKEKKVKMDLLEQDTAVGEGQRSEGERGTNLP